MTRTLCLSFVLKLYLSTRRGAWIINRVGENGMPLDMLFNRVVEVFRRFLPFGYFCSLGENQLNQRFDHALYNLKPKHRYFNKTSSQQSCTRSFQIFLKETLCFRFLNNVAA